LEYNQTAQKQDEVVSNSVYSTESGKRHKKKGTEDIEIKWSVEKRLLLKEKWHEDKSVSASIALNTRKAAHADVIMPMTVTGASNVVEQMTWLFQAKQLLDTKYVAAKNWKKDWL